jgi:hypothetical protein
MIEPAGLRKTKPLAQENSWVAGDFPHGMELKCF